MLFGLLRFRYVSIEWVAEKVHYDGGKMNSRFSETDSRTILFFLEFILSFLCCIFVLSKYMKMKLYTDNVVKKYRKRTVVKGVSISVEQGEIVGLLGPNGAGKTTTFYMMTGLIHPFSGDVYLDQTNITKMPMYKRSQLGVGYLAQEASVFRNMSVEDNIMSVLEFKNISQKERKEKMELTISVICSLKMITRPTSTTIIKIISTVPIPSSSHNNCFHVFNFLI